MKQAISGVAPAEQNDSTVMEVWPSLAIYPAGRTIGSLCEITWPNVYIFRLGHLFALAVIPVALTLYFLRVAPWLGIRYTLTNRKIAVGRGIIPAEERAVELGDFDAIEVEVQPGQPWYDSGDLVFTKAGNEVFRLVAVSRPEGFRQNCLKTQMAYIGVRDARQREEEIAPAAS